MLESNASLQRLSNMILGIESTSHTLSFGLVEEDGRIRPSVSDLFKPNEGGIHPREAADHHSDVAGDLLKRVMQENSVISSVMALKPST